MAKLSLLDCDRTDRYEFELFIDEIRLKDEFKTNKDVTSDCDSENEENYADKLSKLSIIATLGNAIQMNITNQEEDEQLNSSCRQAMDDGLKPKDSLASIVDQLANRYTVEETPVGNKQNVCYKIKNKEPYAKHLSRKPALNKGMSCVFSSVPRKFITTLQMNPLELSVREHRKTGLVEIGKVCIPLYGRSGFTEAVAHHFYEKGYAPYSHSIKTMFDVQDKYNKVVGQMTINLKLTCHGPQTREINPPVCQPDKEKVSPTPIFVNENAFDFPSEKRQCLPEPMMTYIDVNEGKKLTYPKHDEIRKYLRCQKFQELVEKVPERCTCLTMLDQFKKIIYSNDTTAIAEPSGTKTATRQQGGHDSGHNQCPCPKMSENRVSGQNIGNNHAHANTRNTLKDEENKFSCICSKLYGSKKALSEINGAEESSDPVGEREIEHQYEVTHIDEATMAPASIPFVRNPESRIKVTDVGESGTKKKKKKKKGKLKKSCRSNACSSRKDSVSIGSSTFSKDVNRIARNVYPGVNCGHKECIQCPIVVPKNMGWLWTIGKSGNIRFNRRWKPGGIQREVVALIEATRNGKDPEEAINVKPRSAGTKRSSSQVERLKPETTTQSESSFRQTRPSNRAENHKGSTKVAGDQPKEVPTLMVHKHNGQYMFQMNPLPEQDEVGNYVMPEVPADPVQIRLGRRDGLNGLATSESSIDLELVTPKTFAAMKPNKVNKNIQSRG